MSPIANKFLTTIRFGTCIRKNRYHKFEKAVSKLLQKHVTDFGAHIYICRFSKKDAPHWHIGHRKTNLPKIAWRNDEN